MNALLAAVLAAALSLTPAAAEDASPDASSDHWDARITAVTGDVVVHPADGGEDAAAEPDMLLEEGDRVVTDEDSTAEIALDGGSLITLQEKTDFTLAKTQKSDSLFSLSFGSLLAKIQHLGDQRLSVRTPTSVAAVRGTEFGVDASKDGESHVGVFDEGRVEVKGETGATEVLTPNQETSVARGQAPRAAAALKRFAARRQRMRQQVLRLAAVRKNWKALPPARRRAARRALIQKLRERRRERMENRRRNGGRPGERRREFLQQERERRRAGGKPRRRANGQGPKPGEQRPQRRPKKAP